MCKNVTSESIRPHCDNSHAMVCKNGPSSPCFCYFPGFSRVHRGKGEHTCICMYSQELFEISITKTY